MGYIGSGLRRQTNSLESAVVPSSSEILEYLAGQSLEKGLELLDSKGIHLSYTPKVEYLGKPPPFSNAVAGVKSNNHGYIESILPKLVEEVQKQYTKRFGLAISTQAAMQSPELRYIRARLGNWPREPQSSADIQLFEGLPIEGRSLDGIMRHELWHLVEKEQGILCTDMIFEGTAYFVQYRRFSRNNSKNLGLYDILYRNTGFLVKEEVAGFKNPYKQLLKRKTRAKVEDKFNKELLEPLVHHLGNSINDYRFRKFMRDIFMDIKFYSFYFQQTPKNFLIGLNNTGKLKLAEELEGQDLFKLIQFYSKIVQIY